MQPRDLLKQYEKLDKDPMLFVNWMKLQCQAKPGHARRTFDVVNSFNSGEKAAQKVKDAPKKNLNATLLGPIVTNSQQTLKSSALISSQSTPGPTGSECKALVDTSKSEHSTESREPNDSGKDGVNQHLLKLREQFTTMHDTANKKMLDLQLELSKMQKMSHEFDVLMEFLSSDEKVSAFERNLDRLQKTVYLTEEKLQEINTNNRKMSQMIQQIGETAKMQHSNNDKAISKIGERLARWETKLDRVAHRISNHKIDLNELKPTNGGDYAQLKNDIENMLNGRMDELAANMEWMKNVIFGIVVLIVLKTIFFDLNKQKFDDVVRL